MLDFTNDEIIDGVIAEFAELAKIPRKSGHEEAVSNYLKSAFEKIGCQVVQDENLNIIADLPATEGYEKSKLTILQAHMDMVCVAAPGVVYDPLTDPIKLICDETILEADGTSLGADDGIGIAEILYIFKNMEECHGPLRAIITVDEENGMTGAINLDKKYLLDADYLINCDSENFDELTVGSAGSVRITFKRSIKWEKTSGKAYKISVHGLCGGHSGIEIGRGRGNAIRTLALLLLNLHKKGVKYQLAHIDGGKAVNSIPRAAEAVIVTDADDIVIEECIADAERSFVDIYGNVETNAQFCVEAAELPEKVFDDDTTLNTLRLVAMLHTGVFSMSQVKSGLVETSANLGMMYIAEDEIELLYFPRSAIDSSIVEILEVSEVQAALTGFIVEHGPIFPGWKENPKSVLAVIMNELFELQNGFSMQVETIHAGLECGWHFQKNPKLDIVSIGVTTIDIHSPEERLLLESIVPQVKLIVGTLETIAIQEG